jgi:hypothetical protein
MFWQALVPSTDLEGKQDPKGILSEPGHPHHHFRISRAARGILLAVWTAWLAARSEPALGNKAYPPLEDALGATS